MAILRGFYDVTTVILACYVGGYMVYGAARASWWLVTQAWR